MPITLPVVPFLNLQFANFRFEELLADGIESDLCPSSKINKFVSGTYYQGSIRYTVTARIQCISNFFFAICFSAIRNATL